MQQLYAVVVRHTGCRPLGTALIGRLAADLWTTPVTIGVNLYVPNSVRVRAFQIPLSLPFTHSFPCPSFHPPLPKHELLPAYLSRDQGSTVKSSDVVSGVYTALVHHNLKLFRSGRRQTANHNTNNLVENF